MLGHDRATMLVLCRGTAGKSANRDAAGHGCKAERADCTDRFDIRNSGGDLHSRHPVLEPAT